MFAKFTIHFEMPSRRYSSGIKCQSEPLPQWALADFIQSITDAGYELLSVETVEEYEPEDEEEEIMVEEEFEE